MVTVAPSLECAEEGGGAAAPRELAPAPAVNTGFVERCRYRLRAATPGLSLVVDDEPLPGDGSGAWAWAPGFYAGEVSAELHDANGACVGRYRLDVSPNPRKSGKEHFDRMVDELFAADPALVLGVEPPDHAIGSLGEGEDPLVAFARLRQHVPPFVAALRAIAVEPRRALRPRRQAVSPLRARRVDRRTVFAALRTPGLASWLRGGEAAELAIGTGVRLDVPFIEDTLDSAANRCLLALVRGVRRRLLAVVDRLADRAAREDDDPTRTSLARRWPLRRQVLEQLERLLVRELSRPPLAAVRRAEVSASGLNAIATAPLYAHAWRLGWRAIRRGHGGEADERAWLSPTWEIFERWCFLRVASMLGADTVVEGHPSRAFAARRGEHAGRRVEVLLQPVAPSRAPSGRYPLWSVSGQRVPDLVVVIDDPQGRRFVVLDAKYRVSRGSVLEAMTSAHAYQDSLRLADARPFATLLLLPGPTEVDWLQDAAFQQRHRVGIYVLDAPAAEPPSLPGLLARALDPSS